MKQIPYFTYYALLTLSGMGLIQAAYLLFFADKDEKNGGPSPFSRPEAPEGYRWVLMLEAEADARAIPMWQIGTVSTGSGIAIQAE